MPSGSKLDAKAIVEAARCKGCSRGLDVGVGGLGREKRGGVGVSDASARVKFPRPRLGFGGWGL